jgi:hypothetical protein
LILTRGLPNDHFAAIASALCAYATRFPSGMRAYTLDFLQPVQQQTQPG